MVKIMTDKKRNVPKLRFRGFTETWEQRKLGEVSTIVGGGTPSTKNSAYWGGTINWYSPAEIDDQIYVNNSQRKITELGLSKSSASLLPIGTVLFTSRAGIGKTAILGKKACTNQGFQSIIPNKKELDSYFVYTMTAQLKRYGETHGAGSTFVEVSGKQMAKMPVVLPKYEEQIQISFTFKQLDSLVALHQRKQNQLKKVKKALLQKMFADEKNPFPFIRFKGFTEAWEQRKLKELAIFNPKDNLPEEFEYVDLESVIGTEMLSHKKTALSDAPSRAQRLAKKGDIFYQTVRPYQKNDYLFDKDAENYVFSTGYAQIRPKINGNFLFQLLRTERFVKKVLNECTGTSYPAINSKDLSNIKVSYTNYKEEQRSIGSLLDNLDNLVALHQRKLDQLQKLKKSLLQNMFI